MNCFVIDVKTIAMLPTAAFCTVASSACGPLPSVEAAVLSIEGAAFLTAAQKRDIFYNNAARFLRLSPEEIASRHGR